VVDATDNFETRFSLNALCWRLGTPLVSGAAVRMEGQVGVFDPRDPSSACYRCLYTDESGEGEACAQVGVLAPLLGIIGSVQAAETLKLIIGMGHTLAGRFLVLDALHMEWRMLSLPKDPRCPVCGSSQVETSGDDGSGSSGLEQTGS
jgi:adenylyltransferase/sulfurtransferase